VFRLFLASRYMLARPVSYLAMGAIGVAVGALIVVISVMNGFLDETRRYVRGTTADIIVVAHPDDRGRVPPRADLERTVTADPLVEGACSRLLRPAVVKVHGRIETNLGDSLGAELSQVIVLGIDPQAEAHVTGLEGYLTRIKHPALRVADPADPFNLPRTAILDRELRNAGLPKVLVGESRMRVLGLVKGDALEMVTVPEGEAVQQDQIRATTETFVIAGAFETGHHTFDMSNVFVTREAFRDWTGTRHEVSEMCVRVKEGADLSQVRDRLSEALRSAGLAGDVDRWTGQRPVIVETWTDRHKVYLGAVENERNILGFVLSLFVLLTCTITFSMLTMMVQEKVRDIGILSAMGASASGIGAVFAVCGVYVAGVGGLFGLLAGELVAGNVNVVKDWIEGTFDIQIFNRNVYAFTEIPTTVHHELNWIVVGCTACFSVIICLLPALRAARMDPVEALRHE
jgi:lipoprotein-releasing system permease protein